jgi:hypothetical protein
VILPKQVLNWFPENYEKHIFIDLFGGNGNLWFFKKRSRKEIFNDYWLREEGASSLPRMTITLDVLSNPEKRKMFLKYSPYDSMHQDIHIAYSSIQCWSWEKNILRGAVKVRRSMINAAIENDDPIKIVKKYDNWDVLFFGQIPREYAHTNDLMQTLSEVQGSRVVVLGNVIVR